MKNSTLFTLLSSLFCVALVVSNLVAGKLYAAPYGITLTAGVWLFPIVYIIGDVIPEVYGLKVARQVIWIGFICNLIAVGIFLLTIILPYPSYWQGQEAFATVLGFTPRLLLASFIGYLAGTNINAYIMVTMKRFTNGNLLWLRTISSTIFGEFADSILFLSIAFFGTLPLDIIFTMIIAQALFKILYEVLFTPITYMVVYYVNEKELWG
jgi:queuosine precursor transporter